ncbi:MAG: hypothetical protein ABIJ84_00265 [bacterium]
MKTKYLIYTIFGFLIISSVVFGGRILAQNSGTANVQYPVQELGNCENEQDCRAYCDKPTNQSACLDFAQKNNLMSEEEVEMAKKFLAKGGKGPGGCVGKDSCEEYCDNISHIDECISYAEENGFLSGQELEEAKKVQSAIARGIKPPPCNNKKQCDVYCEEPEHMEECITFGVEAGFIHGKEAEDAQKMLQAVKRGIKPPPCRGREECDEYCSSPDNMEVCMNFAMEAGFMSEQEKADSQKMLSALRKGIKPPNCRGREECDSYCEEPEHMEECITFALAAGFMSEEDAVMARKTGGKGPGGCKGKEECESFCNNPDNQETCFNFAKDNGMIPEEDLKRMEEGKQQMRQTLEQAPAEVLDCLQGEIGADMVEKMKNGIMPPRDMGDKMQICFQKMGPPQGERGSMGPGQPGPGGCQTPGECQSYCQNNPDECKNFQPGPGEINPGGQMMPEQAGPGGCKTPEECQSFCQDNPEQCQNFGPAGQENQRPPEDYISQGQPCEGENCQYDLPREGQPQMIPEEFHPSDEEMRSFEEAGQIKPPTEMIPQNQQQPPQEFHPQELPPPPPPSDGTLPPSGFIINTDSFVGSLIYAAFRFLISQQ